MKIKTSEATDRQLNWVVAKCEGLSYSSWRTDGPATDWSEGGPIIEREGIALHRGQDGLWWARIPPEHFKPQILTSAPTPLIAAMRCYVASKLGEEVDVPDEFK